MTKTNIAHGSTEVAIPDEFSDIAAICAATDVAIGGRMVLGIADARTLHQGLSVGRDYPTWIAARIAKYGFQEGVDYQAFDSPNRGNQSGRGGDRRSQEYRLTLDMAKELAMVENNETGRRVRRYFIWAESIAHAVLAQVSVADLEAQVRRTFGGIVKGILNKGLDEHLVPLLARLQRLEDGYDPRVTVTDFLPMIDVLKAEKVLPRKRRALSQRCSRDLLRFCVATEQRQAFRLSRETGRYLFQQDAIREWLDKGGRRIIEEHKEVVAGQSVLPFGKRKTPDWGAGFLGAVKKAEPGAPA